MCEAAGARAHSAATARDVKHGPATGLIRTAFAKADLGQRVLGPMEPTEAPVAAGWMHFLVAGPSGSRSQGMTCGFPFEREGSPFLKAEWHVPSPPGG